MMARGSPVFARPTVAARDRAGRTACSSTLGRRPGRRRMAGLDRRRPRLRPARRERPPRPAARRRPHPLRLRRRPAAGPPRPAQPGLGGDRARPARHLHRHRRLRLRPRPLARGTGHGAHGRRPTSYYAAVRFTCRAHIVDDPRARRTCCAASSPTSSPTATTPPSPWTGPVRPDAVRHPRPAPGRHRGRGQVQVRRPQARRAPLLGRRAPHRARPGPGRRGSARAAAPPGPHRPWRP